MLDSWVKAVLLEGYAVDIGALRKSEKSLKFSDRLRCTFKNSGKPFDEQLKSEVKGFISLRAIQSGIAGFDPGRLAPIHGLLREIERRISA